MAKFTLKTLSGFMALTSAVACIPAGDGVEAPPERIYFPVSLSMSQAHRLIVVNSDFDLQFSQGTVQSLDVTRIEEVTQKPCNDSNDCENGTVCDSSPTEENDASPSYVCVPADDLRPCGDFGEKSVAGRAVAPGRCAPVDLKDPQDGGARLLVDVAKTSAFATEGLLLSRPCTDGGDSSRPCAAGDEEDARIQPRNGTAYPERLFIPVRGDTTIHYIDVDEEGRFHCNRPAETSGEFDFEDADDYALRCKGHRIYRGQTFGVDDEGNFVVADELPLPGDLDADELADIEDDPTNEFLLQPEPIDLAASDGGRFIAVSHQMGGMVSSLMNNWIDPPALVHVLRGLSNNPLGIAGIPRVLDSTASLSESESDWDFLLSYRTDSRIDLLHFDDGGLLGASTTAPTNSGGEPIEIFRPAMAQVDSTPVITNSNGTHSRGLVVDDRNRQAEIVACNEDESCIEAAKAEPMLVYVTNRTPSSLLIGLTGGESELAEASLTPRFFNTIPLSAGPSRVLLGNVIGPDGSLLPRVFVICFDAGLIYVFDPVREVVESVLRTGRGPYSLAFNYEQGVVYVGHFTDSYIGVISIDQRYPFTYGATLATLGEPEPPRATE